MAVYDSNNLQYTEPMQALVPQDGPKAIPLRLDFSGSVTEYDLDLTNPISYKKITMVQTIFLDLSAATTDVTVTMPISGQVIKGKAGTQGYYPVLCPNPPRFVFTSAASNAVVAAFLMNFPVAGVVWTA